MQLLSESEGRNIFTKTSTILREGDMLNKKIKTGFTAVCIGLAAFMLFISSTRIFSMFNSPVQVNLAIVSSDKNLAIESLKIFSQNDFIKVIDKRDLKTIIRGRQGRSIELMQPGIINDIPDKNRMADIEYIFQIDKKEEDILGHLIKVSNSRILGAWNGPVEYISGRCSDRLEAESALKNLYRLKSPVSGIDVNIRFKKKKYRLGDKLEFEVESDESGYLYIIDIQPGGDTVLLVPNAAHKVFKITKGKKIRIPGNTGFSLRIVPPIGIDTIKVIVTKNRINILQCEGLSEEGFVKEVEAGKKPVFTRSVEVLINKLDKNGWGEDTAEIEVMR